MFYFLFSYLQIKSYWVAVGLCFLLLFEKKKKKNIKQTQKKNHQASKIFLGDSKILYSFA